MNKAIIREFMTTNVTSISMDTPVAETAEIMQRNGLSSVVIIEHGTPVGVISERDMVNLCAKLLNGGHPPKLKNLMSSNVVCISAEQTCDYAEKVMNQNKVRHLITTEPNGLLCGMFTNSDLLRSKRYNLEQQQQQSDHKISQLSQSLVDAQSRLKRVMLEDSLLKIGNRQAMDKALALRASQNTPYAVAVIDIDQLKQYNDYYNHEMGDNALVKVSQLAQAILLGQAQLFRQSGNTLLALFNDNESIDKQAALNGILNSVFKLELENKQSALGRLTVSIGLAYSSNTILDTHRVVYLALQARDNAKKQGGNQISQDTESKQKAA